MRYLGLLVDLAHRVPKAVQPLGGKWVIDRYKSFIQANAESIWSRAACTLGSGPVAVGEQLAALPVFGPSWVHPCGTMPGAWTAAAQTSALDVLVAQQEVACRDDGESGGGGKDEPPRGLSQYFNPGASE